MSFGDWEMFKVVLISLRERELSCVLRQNEIKAPKLSKSDSRRGSQSKMSGSDKDIGKLQVEGPQRKQSAMEKQVSEINQSENIQTEV